jgi:hypothetical protein
MAGNLAISLLSGALTGTGAGEVVDLGGYRSAIEVQRSVAALSGEVTFTIETSLDANAWRAVRVDKTHTADAKAYKLFGLDRYLRCSFAAASCTAVITGTAKTAYVTPDELRSLGIPAKALDKFPDEEIWPHCLAISDECEGYLAGAYTPPIVAWGDDLRRHAAAMVAHSVVSGMRGLQPAGPDASLTDGRTFALQWLNRVSAGTVRPTAIVDSKPEVFEGGAVVTSKSSRGWDELC